MGRTARRCLSNGGGIHSFDGLTRVLVADDLRENWMVPRGYLKRSDLKIVEAGNQALAALRVRPFDLPIPRMQIPGLTGAEVFAAVRRSAG